MWVFMRFYIEGNEIDVEDPLFHLPIEKVDEMIKYLTEYKNEFQPF